jgi:hypothetical protein
MNKCFIGYSAENGNTTGACCCNCKFHLKDFLHCTTVKRDEPECVCNTPKGWICVGLEDRAYSGWSEHSMCEMHMFKPTNK